MSTTNGLVTSIPPGTFSREAIAEATRITQKVKNIDSRQPLRRVICTGAEGTILVVSAFADPVPVYTYKVVGTYPHDLHAFTQGLAFEAGVLYEGTGLRGRSTLRKVELETGNILQSRELPPQVFGEGITVFGNRIIQLTWRSNVGYVYSKDSLDLLQDFNYPTEGWGITHDGQRLIMSDGTSTLYFLDATTFEETGRIEVHDADGLVTRLNELEYVQGELYSNVFQTDRIARIAPDTGKVIGWIDLKALLGPHHTSEPVGVLKGMSIGLRALADQHGDPVNVFKGIWARVKEVLGSSHRIAPVDILNGIAYDAANDRLFVTGKFWPKLFEIELIPIEQISS